MTSIIHLSRLAADIEMLKRLRKSVTLDFIKWQDSTDSKHWHPAAHTRSQRRNPFKAPILLRQGSNATLHNATASALAALPESVRRCDLAGAEISVDFQAKGCNSEQEQAQLLADALNLLVRRLAPWGCPFISPRIFIATGGPEDRAVDSGHPLIRVDARGTPRLLKLRPHKRLVDVRWPVAIAGSFSHLETIYYGEKVNPTWTDVAHLVNPQIQLRVYIKVEDNDRPLPRDLWRTRVEVVMNGPAIYAVLGARRVGDLLTTSLKALGTRYLKLACAHPSPRTPARSPTPVHALILARRAQLDMADAEAAAIAGNHLQSQHMGLIFKNKKALNRPIVDALRDYGRSVARAEARSAGASV